MFLNKVKVALLVTSLLTTSFAFADTLLEDSVHYLASDALEGRKPGTPGNELAKKYIESELKKSGLAPFAKSFRQEFTIFTEMVKYGDNSLKVIDGQNEDLFQPLSYSLTSKVENADLVFAGFGISIPESDTVLKYNDYKNIDVKDKVVIIMSGDPGVGNPNSLFRKPEYLNYQTLHYKIKNAVTRGAKGVLILTNPLSLENYPNETAPYFNATDGGGKRFSAISGLVTNKWLNSLLKDGHSTKSIQETIAKTQKPFSIDLKKKVNLSVALKKKTGRVANIVGVLEGNDPVLKKEVIVLGAHFDHLGHGGDSSMDHSQIGQIHNGADDNASGTSMVLALARDLAKKKLKRTYIFILFNAEEVGLLGSSHFVSMWARHGKEYGKLYAMLNFDMIGRYNKELSLMGLGTSKEWKSMVTPLTSSIKITKKDDALGASDHASFTDKNIPALFFTTGAHEDYHRATDTSDKIKFKAMKDLRIYAGNLIDQLDLSKSLPFNKDYNTTKPGNGQNRGYGAHLGCVPQFGQSDDIKGVLCMRASADSPAMKAGIVAGDVLIQIGDIDINNIYDLAFALKYYRAGDKIEIAWKRDGKRLAANITLAKSKR